MEQMEKYMSVQQKANEELNLLLETGEAVADLFAKYSNEQMALEDITSDRFWIVREILNRCAQLMAAPFLRASGWKVSPSGQYVRRVM